MHKDVAAVDRRTYRSWYMMMRRCSNPKDAAFHNYGGRGIRVCARWRQYVAFAADMGKRPAGLTLERVDNDQGYRPGNVIWADRKVQARNRRTTVRVTFAGKTRTLQAWADETGIPGKLLWQRLFELGWPPSRALTIEVDHRPKNVPVSFNGKTQTYREWAAELHIPYYLVYNRVRKGWTIEDALMTPYKANARPVSGSTKKRN